MIPLHGEPWYRFRFAEPRWVMRFHLDGADRGQIAVIHHLEPDEQTPGKEFLRARVGPEGWVELTKPLLVQPGQGFAVRLVSAV